VWARAADHAEVEKYFRQIIESTARAGVHTSVAEDKNLDNPSGSMHTLIYQITSDDKADGGYTLTMLTLEQPGDTFQATVWEARFTIK
jgi:hypothetical protein